MTTRPLRSLRMRRDDDERGSVLVELTMILPLLVTLVLGMMEVGMAWKDQQTITQASRQGARVGSQMATDATADQQSVAAVMAVLDNEQRSNINFIMVYEPANAEGDPSPACQVLAGSGNAGASGIPNQCSYWGKSILSNPAFDATTITSSDWGPADRDDTLSSTGPDRYGVLVEVYRPWFTGFFPGDGTEIRAKSIMQLEPDIS